jgi:hypothetical protein
VAEADQGKMRRVITKWVVYATLLGLIFLITFVLDRNREHDEHALLSNRLAATIGAFVTLGLYSFLFGDNEVYRFLEHLIVGVVAAQWFAVGLREAFNPMWLKPVGHGLKLMAGGALDARFFWSVGGLLAGVVSLLVFHKLRLALVGWIVSALCFGGSAFALEYVRATTHGHWNLYLLWLLAPIPGACWYMIYSKKYLWLSRLVTVLVIGAYIGKDLQLNFANLVSQIHGSFKPVWSPEIAAERGTWAAIDFAAGNVIFVVVTLVVLFYFVFTFKIGDKLAVRRTYTISRLFMMVAFGIVFATVVGTRMGLVVDRILFLVESWAKPIVYSWF